MVFAVYSVSNSSNNFTPATAVLTVLDRIIRLREIVDGTSVAPVHYGLVKDGEIIDNLKLQLNLNLRAAYAAEQSNGQLDVYELRGQSTYQSRCSMYYDWSPDYGERNLSSLLTQAQAATNKLKDRNGFEQIVTDNTTILTYAREVLAELSRATPVPATTA